MANGIGVSLRAEYRAFTRFLTVIEREQLPFAVARALTDTARDGQVAVTSMLPTVFDRPTPFTLRATRIEAARKDNWRSIVALKDIQAQYLLLQETGGDRTAAMNTRKPGVALVEPNKVTLDSFGNIPPGLLAKLRRQAKGDARARAKIQRIARKSKKATGEAAVSAVPDSGVFLLNKGSPANKAGVGGYFARVAGHKLMRLTSWSASAHYRARFGFGARVTATARSNLLGHLATRMAEAVASRRD